MQKISPNNIRIAYGLVVTILVWAGATVVSIAARVFARAYSNFGADLPVLTLLMIDLSRAAVPWLWATGATALLGYILVKRPAWVPVASVAVLVLTVLGLAFALLAFVEPVALCGDYWPEWPSR